MSIVLNPLLYRSIDPIDALGRAAAAVCGGCSTAASALDGGAVSSRDAGRPGTRHRAVLIGFGPTGRTVERLLKETGVEPTVIELNIDTVREIRLAGVDAVYGDATRPETLIEAGIQSARNLILTSAGMANSTEVIRAAREAQPDDPRARARAPICATCPS